MCEPWCFQLHCLDHSLASALHPKSATSLSRQASYRLPCEWWHPTSRASLRSPGFQRSPAESAAYLRSVPEQSVQVSPACLWTWQQSLEPKPSSAPHRWFSFLRVESRPTLPWSFWSRGESSVARHSSFRLQLGRTPACCYLCCTHSRTPRIADDWTWSLPQTPTVPSPPERWQKPEESLGTLVCRMAGREVPRIPRWSNNHSKQTSWYVFWPETRSFIVTSWFNLTPSIYPLYRSSWPRGSFGSLNPCFFSWSKKSSSRPISSIGRCDKDWDFDEGSGGSDDSPGACNKSFRCWRIWNTVSTESMPRRFSNSSWFWSGPALSSMEMMQSQREVAVKTSREAGWLER